MLQNYVTSVSMAGLSRLVLCLWVRPGKASAWCTWRVLHSGRLRPYPQIYQTWLERLGRDKHLLMMII